MCLDLYSKEDGLVYIDWEWYYYGDGAFDFAKLYNDGLELLPWSINLTSSQENILLESYNEEMNDLTLKERIGLWQTYIQFTDLIYFIWKVNNYNPLNSAFSKKEYETICTTLLNHLKKKYL
ncbi:MAG: hypothetical protein ACQESC_03860 [Nanobdellota archaeon]